LSRESFAMSARNDHSGETPGAGDESLRETLVDGSSSLICFASTSSGLSLVNTRTCLA
jgi:hypothetical protein